MLMNPSQKGAVLNSFPWQCEYFDNLTYTHHKEQIVWIEAAKKQETQANRIEKTLKMIRGKRTV